MLVNVIISKMKITVESINTLLSKVGMKLASKDGKVELSSAKVELMAEGKTADGTTLATPADEWANGVEAFVVDAEGNPTPAPDGEYTFEDGSKVVVAGGVVTEYVMVEAKAEEQEMSSEDIASVVSALGEQVNALTEQVNNLTTERDNANTELSKMKETNASLSKEVAKLSKVPAVLSSKEEAKKGGEEKPMTRAEQIMFNLQEKTRVFGERENSNQ